MKFNIRGSQKMATIAFAVIWFFAGLVIMHAFSHVQEAKADGDRLFELRIYHDLPGKLPVMEARFRDKTSKILARHNLTVLGYWETTDRSASENLFVFLIAHPSRAAAKENWQAVVADPEFQEVEKAEQNERTLEKAEVIYLRAANFSEMK